MMLFVPCPGHHHCDKVEIPLFDDGENILDIQAAAIDPVLGMLTEVDR